MTTDDGDGGLGGVLQTGELLGESLGTNDVKGGDTEQTLGVENTGVLEDLGGNGDGGVDGVGDDQDESLGAILGDTLNEIADNAGVDLEEVITGHTGLAYSWVSWEEAPIVSFLDLYLRGIPAGMTTTSAPVRAFLRPSSLGRKPEIF